MFFGDVKMCGIIGYFNQNNNVVPSIIKGLEFLEYRGYDSWGIASVFGNKLKVIKKVGSIVEFDFSDELDKSSFSIGHTRWSTHGKVIEKNSHPHVSNDRKIAVVHNGIIENYQELKNYLINQGYKFYSGTDTEIIPNLFSHYLKMYDLKTVVNNIMNELKGSYAILALMEDKVIFMKNKSPLIVANGNGFMASSDVSCFSLQGSKEAVFLEDRQWGYYDFLKGKLNIFYENKKIDLNYKKIKENNLSSEKKEFKHHMLKEIYEQPEVIIKSSKQDNLEKAKQLINVSENVLLTACGTSYHSCLAFHSFSDIKSIPFISSEWKTYDSFFNKKNCMIIVSQSGETADLIEVVENAKSKGVKIIGIINSENSTLWGMCDVALGMNAGKEIGVASTKAFIASLNIFSNICENNNDIKQMSENCKKYLDYWRKKAKEVIKYIDRDLFVIGRDEAYAYACESALKIKELSYIRAEAMAGGELKHGTLALIEKGTPVIAIVLEKNKKEMMNNIMEIKSRGGKIIGIGKENHSEFDFFIQCPNEMIFVIPSQLIAYELCVIKGFNPDKPRNLAKCVTVK